MNAIPWLVQFSIRCSHANHMSLICTHLFLLHDARHAHSLSSLLLSVDWIEFTLKEKSLDIKTLLSSLWSNKSTIFLFIWQSHAKLLKESQIENCEKIELIYLITYQSNHYRLMWHIPDTYVCAKQIFDVFNCFR